MSSPRPDREDVTAQTEALGRARAQLQRAADDLAAASCAEPGPSAPGGTADRGRPAPDAPLQVVAQEAAALSRTLRSRARRPPAPDTAALAGAVSAAERAAARSDAWDAAVTAVRAAEAGLDVASVDLAAARGEDV